MSVDNELEELLGPSSPLGPKAEPPGVSLVPTSSGGDSMQGAFDGANQFDQSLALWAPPIQSADREIIPEKEILDARSSDMFRNDAYAAGAIDIHQDSIVGSMFVLNSKPATKLLFGQEDETWEDEFQEEVEERFDLFAESPDCWIDVNRTNTFTQLVRLAVGIDLAGGEVLASAEWKRDFGRPFSTAIKMIDLARLSDPQDRVMPFSLQDRIRGGIEKNPDGAPVAYYIRERHPTDFNIFGDNYKWKRVSARKPWGRPQIIHLFQANRAEQSRGVSKLVSALKEMKITRKVRELTLQNMATQSMYAAAITSDLPSETVMAQIGGGQGRITDMEKVISDYGTAYLNSIAKYTKGASNLQIDGVKIPHLYPGTKLDLMSPKSGGVIGSEFEMSLLRYLAASVGVSYEQFARDYTNTNYSSARAAINETNKYMQSRKKATADRFATIIFRLWLEEAINKGIIKSLPRAARRPGWLYEAQRLDAISRCDWIGASRGQIDEKKETEAAVLRLENNLSTAEDEIARFGRDWRKVYRQRRREVELQKLLGITSSGMVKPGPDSDNDADDAAENKQQEKAA